MGVSVIIINKKKEERDIHFRKMTHCGNLKPFFYFSSSFRESKVEFFDECLEIFFLKKIFFFPKKKNFPVYFSVPISNLFSKILFRKKKLDGPEISEYIKFLCKTGENFRN